MLILMLVSPFLAAISIGEIKFEANFEINETDLLRVSRLAVGQQYDAQKVSDAILAMQEHLIHRGNYYISFNNPELVPLPDGDLQLKFRVERFLDSSRCKIRFKGLKHFSESSLHKLVYSSGEAEYPLAELPIFMQRVLDEYHNRAYLFAKVELDSLVMGEELVAWIGVDEGKIFEAGQYRFRGNKITRESSILKNSGLLGEHTITPAKMRQAEQNLKLKPYIFEARILPLDHKSLLIEITEGRMTYLEGVLGLSEDNGKRKISGLMNINFQNLWGTDRAIDLYWRSNPSQYSELRFRYHESGVPSLPLAADLSFARSNQDSLWILSSAELELYYKSLYQKFGISGAARSVLPGSSSSAMQSSSAQRIGALWAYQNTLGERIPTDGLELKLKYEMILSDQPYNAAASGGMKVYKPVWGRFIGHLNLNIQSYENPEVEEYDLYRMGGYGSLRGYSEDEVKSWRLGWANLELRYMLGPQSMIYMFYDHGIAAISKDKYKRDLLAVGVGISMGTRLGILNLGYGLPYRDKSFSSLALGMVHMGLDISL